MMALDRGKLAKIDRRVFSELDHGDGTQTVKVPVSDAVWASWHRYCDAIGMTMGEGVAGLIDHELASVVATAGHENIAVFASRAEERIVVRESELAAREDSSEVVEVRLRGWSEQLRRWEDELETRELRAGLASKLASQRPDLVPKAGRNERCPCGSGMKYKRCHGLSGR